MFNNKPAGLSSLNGAFGTSKDAKQPISSTISKDKTKGDQARNSELLAEFGRRTQSKTSLKSGNAVEAVAQDKPPVLPNSSRNSRDTVLRDEDTIVIRVSPPSNPRSQDGSELFVTGIHPRVSEETLKTVFDKSGGLVEKCEIMHDPSTMESRGFGFVKMFNVEHAEIAMKALQGLILEGRSLNVTKNVAGGNLLSPPSLPGGSRLDLDAGGRA